MLNFIFFYPETALPVNSIAFHVFVRLQTLQGTVKYISGKAPLRYPSRVSRNPNLFEYMSFWAHDKRAQITLQSMQTWYFFQMMHFFW